MKIKSPFLTAFLLASVSAFPSLIGEVNASEVLREESQDSAAQMPSFPALKSSSDLEELQRLAKAGNRESQKEVLQQIMFYNKLENFLSWGENVSPEVKNSPLYAACLIKYSSPFYPFPNDFTQQLSALKPLAEKGNEDAQYALYLASKNDRFRDIVTAAEGFDFLKKAAFDKNFILAQVTLADRYFFDAPSLEKDKKFTQHMNDLREEGFVERKMLSFLQSGAEKQINGAAFFLARTRFHSLHANLIDAGEAWKWLTHTFNSPLSHKDHIDRAETYLHGNYIKKGKDPNSVEKTEEEEKKQQELLEDFEKKILAIGGFYALQENLNNGDLAEEGVTYENGDVAEKSNDVLSFNDALFGAISRIKNKSPGFMVSNFKETLTESPDVEYAGTSQAGSEIRYYPKFSMFCVGKENVAAGDAIYKALHPDPENTKKYDFSDYLKQINEDITNTRNNLNQASKKLEKLKTQEQALGAKKAYVENIKYSFEKRSLPVNEDEIEKDYDDHLKKIVLKLENKKQLLDLYKKQLAAIADTGKIKEIPTLIYSIVFNDVHKRNQHFADAHPKLFKKD